MKRNREMRLACTSTASLSAQVNQWAILSDLSEVSQMCSLLVWVTNSGSSACFPSSRAFRTFTALRLLLRFSRALRITVFCFAMSNSTRSFIKCSRSVLPSFPRWRRAARTATRLSSMCFAFSTIYSLHWIIADG